MRLYDGWFEILKIQKFRRIVSYAGFYSFTALLSYAYTSNTTRAGYSRADQFYASYPAGTEMLTDTAKLYKAALGNCFEAEEWGPIEWCILAKHFERQGKSPYAYHAEKLARPSFLNDILISGPTSSVIDGHVTRPFITSQRAIHGTSCFSGTTRWKWLEVERSPAKCVDIVNLLGNITWMEYTKLLR